MSSRDLDEVVNLTAQRLKKCRADDVVKMLDAATELLRESSLEAFTVEAVAEKAGVSAVTAADAFETSSALIIQICLRRIRSVSLTTDAPHGSIARVASQLSRVMLIVAEEPALASACAAVFLKSGFVADRAHAEIGLEIHRIIASAVGPGSWPEVITTLEFIFSGALIQAAVGASSFQRAADGVQTAVSLILEGAPLY